MIQFTESESGSKSGFKSVSESVFPTESPDSDGLVSNVSEAALPPVGDVM